MPNTEIPVKIDELTAFQRDCIRMIWVNQPCNGTTIKEDMETEYEGPVNTSHLYPNINELIELGIVDKKQVDGRTYHYSLTDKGGQVAESISQLWDNDE